MSWISPSTCSSSGLMVMGIHSPWLAGSPSTRCPVGHSGGCCSVFSVGSHSRDHGHKRVYSKKMYLGGCKLSQNLTVVHPAIFATLRMSLDCEQKRRNWATPKYQLQNVLIPSYKGIVFPSTFVRVENPNILQERIGASRGLAAF
ncbi:hypothetical protein ZEAMMB73_Zm00001d019389 [Zea mays]|uniref:Uncharacterized protein n=1 Tax=Zea mays TaxID=4577 RepID=A0A1D6HX89_MAIZE|nr:hypothetical protein ZEAMMB73_Zm00001d019389 [Zea mays]